MRQTTDSIQTPDVPIVEAGSGHLDDCQLDEDKKSDCATVETDCHFSFDEEKLIVARPAIIITIDGPAGTGKSTVAHQLSRRLGLDFLDTGAMYRAVALMAVEQGIDPADGCALAACTERASMHFDWSPDPPRLHLGDRDVTDRIRDLDVGAVVSIVAAQPEIRTVLVAAQRRIAEAHPRLVTEGRDQGSTVFPDAAVRFFLEADASVRARRRVDQLRQAGKQFEVADVVRDIEQRDTLDRSRSDGPLIRPDGATDVDTSQLSIDEVVTAMETHVRATVNPEVLDPGRC